MSADIASLYRDRLAKEQGTVRKDWGGKISIALAYPNYYRIGMSNLGFQLVYHLFNQKNNVVAERLFMPEGAELSFYLETGKELLSLESQVPFQKFDLIAFSLSFENDYPNILRMLELGKIPLLSDERNDFHPLVMAGGITTFLNPEPLAIFFDFFLLGEAEALLDEFVDLLFDMKRTTRSRKEVFEILSREGKSLYVPSLYRVEYEKNGTLKSMIPVEGNLPEKIARARKSRSDSSVAKSTLLAPETELADRILIELGRGCGRSCRFCAAGFIYRPPRQHLESELTACIDELMKDGASFGLLSAAVSDTPGIGDLTDHIVKEGCRFSVSSLRADSLTEDLLSNLKAAGQKTVAIAPEAGSDKLRKVLNKHLSQAQIIEAVRLITKIKDFSLRLYFLIGLPQESRDDVAEILTLVKSIKHHMIKESRQRGRIGRIKLSINCFIPKPFTPFQWFPLENKTTLKEKQKWLKKSFAREGGIKANFDLPKWAYLQALLSLGDRRVGPILLRAHEMNGNWTKALRFSEINPDFFVYRPKGLNEILPWDFIDHGLDKNFLIREYKRALDGRESDVCPMNECERCGVCS